MKKVLGLVLILAMVFSCFTIGASAATTSATEIESNNEAVNATAITGNSITGELQDKNDVDWYKFEADKDYFEVDFKINQNSLGLDAESGWNVMIYDAEMNEIVKSNGVTEVDGHRFAFSGTIYVKVAANNSAYWPAGMAYDVIVTKTEDAHWEDETNGASNTAQIINTNEKYTASMYKSNDVDWFKFTSLDYFVIDFGVNVALATDAVENTWDVFVYDGSLQEIAKYGSVTDFVSAPLTFEGDVYVKVVNQNTGYPNNYIYYDLTANTYEDETFETEYNNASNEANVISAGTKYTGNLHTNRDVDFFKFKSASAAFKVKFDIDLNEVSVDEIESGWTVSIYPADSAAPLASYDVDSVGSFESITLPYAKGKEYFVKVAAQNYGYAPVYQPYHITIVDAADGKKWESENGTTNFAGATTLPDAAKYYGNLSYNRDVDTYKYAVAATGGIKVAFARPDSADDNEGYLVQLKNSAGVLVKEMVINDTKTASFTAKVYKGTYYIVVQARNYGYAPSNEINYWVKADYTLSKPTLSTVAASGKKAVKATWKKVSYINGYQVQYSTSKSFSSAKTKTVNKNSTTSLTIKSLSANKTYYVRIRSYIKIGEKVYYSAWTSAKSTKTK